MCYCTGTIDESTEPDPGITFGCKQTSHTISATWGQAVHTVYFVLFSPLQLCNIMQPCYCPFSPLARLEAVSCCNVLSVFHIKFPVCFITCSVEPKLL